MVDATINIPLVISDNARGFGNIDDPSKGVYEICSGSLSSCNFGIEIDEISVGISFNEYDNIYDI
jgi:hypothetical protein